MALLSFVDSTPRAYRLKGSNAYLAFSTKTGASPWLDRAARVMKGAERPFAPFPELGRYFAAIDARPAVARARAIGGGHAFKQPGDEESKRALFPSNYSV
jgi:hypothetical protein